MESAESIRREIVRRYNTDPRGWHVLVGRDIRGHYDTVIMQGPELWIIKEENINPYQRIGFGVNERLDDKTILDKLPKYTFGFRAVPERPFFESLIKDQTGRKMQSLLSKVLQKDPVPIQSIESSIALQGPITYSERNPQVISQKQSEIDIELREALERLINRKYPHLKTTYG